MDELQQLGLQSDAGAGDAADTVARAMLESNVDSTDWKLEVERILPQLRATVQTESKVACQQCLISAERQSSPFAHYHYRSTVASCHGHGRI